MTSTIVTVYGRYLHKTSYDCVFGTSKSPALRVSSRVLRCRLPENLSEGRHLFNVAVDNSIATSVDSKPLHFTLYSSCIASRCQGTCHGPLCLCPRGKTGVACEVIELKPQIDQHFLANQVATKAEEGTPYIVYLPTIPGTVLRVNSSIPGLHFDTSRSLLEWADPIGNNKPYDVTVVADSLAGENSISWNVSVAPTYSAIIDDVTSEGNRMLIRGSIKTDKKSSTVPVLIQISRTNEMVEQKEVETDENGHFSLPFLPFEQGVYTIVALHPGQSESPNKPFQLAISKQKSHFDVEEGANSRVIDTGNEKCSAKLLAAVNGTISNLNENNSNKIRVTFTRTLDNDAFVKLNCNWEEQIVRLPKDPPPIEPMMTSIPEKIILRQNLSSPLSTVHEIIIYPSTAISSPLSITSDAKLYILATYPPLEDYTEYSGLNKSLKVSLQFDISSMINTTIDVSNDEQILLSIPLIILSQSSNQFVGDNFLLSICLTDELSTISTTRMTERIVSISITNLQTKHDATQNNVIVNGNPVNFWIPEGFYEITTNSPYHYPLNVFAKLSPHNSHVCYSLTSKSPLVMSTKDNTNFMLTNINKQQGILPYLQLSPSVINSSTTKVLVTIQGSVSGTVAPRSIDNDLFTMSPEITSVKVNDSFWYSLKHKKSIDTPTDCVIQSIDIPYDFVPFESDDVISAISPIGVQVGTGDREEGVCDENGNKMSTGRVTDVLCDCSQGAKAECRKKYRSAAACGSAWQRIPDDTISLQVISTFLLLITECSDVHLNFTELYDTLQCVSSLESKCPISPQRIKREAFPDDYPDIDVLMSNHSDERLMMVNDGPASIIKHLSTLSSFGNGIPLLMQPQMMNVFNALDMQSIRIAGLYQDFITRMKETFPPFIFEIDRETIDRLILSIGDHSEDGNFISTTEELTIKNKQLSSMWNATVQQWNSGRWIDKNEDGIQYSDMKQLVSAADRLKSFTRQNGGTDPFSVLHDYLGRLLKTSNYPNEVCASASVVIEPEEIFENDVINVKAYVTNTYKTPLKSVSLTLEIVKNEPFSPSATLIANGISVNTLTSQSSLSPGESFEASWSKRIGLSKKLTSTAEYQLILIFSFTVDDKETKQRLSTSTIRVRPIRTMRIVHFLAPSLSSPTVPFSVMSSLMNIGYSSLSDVRVEGTQITVNDKNGKSLPFHFDTMILDGKEQAPFSSFDVGTIESGASKALSFNLSSSDSDAYISKIHHDISAEGSTIAVDDSSTYIVKAAIGKHGYLVHLPNMEEPSFFFRPETGGIVNIVNINFQKSTLESETNPTRKIVKATFSNGNSRGLNGFLWGSLPYPGIKSDLQLVQINGMDNNRQREIKPITWIEQNDQIKRLNFIDSSLFPFSYSQQYEFIFANPHDVIVPQFEQNSYRIQLIQDNWPTPNDVIGQITVSQDKDNNNNNNEEDVEYSLYSPNDSQLFSVQPKTGQIFVDSTVMPGQEICLVLVAKNKEGQETRVPVAINTGGIRGECVLFNTQGLTPLVHPDLEATTESPDYTTDVISPDSTLSQLTTTTLLATPDPDMTTTSMSSGSTVDVMTTTDNLDTVPTETTHYPSSTEESVTSSESTMTSSELTTESTMTSSEQTMTSSPIDDLTTSDDMLTVPPWWMTSSSNPWSSVSPSDVTTTSGEVTSSIGTESGEWTTSEGVTDNMVTTSTGSDVTTSETMPTGSDVTTPEGLTSSDWTTTEIIYTMSSEASPETIDPSDWTTTIPEVTSSTMFPTPPIIIIPTDGSGITRTTTESMTSSTTEMTSPTVTSETTDMTSAEVTSESPETSTTEEDRYYAEACTKTSIPIWNLLCVLSKTIIRKNT